jgi:DNA-directed RNA polymerase specialized sigma subunit
MASEYLNNRTFESIIYAFQHHKRQKLKYELIMIDLKETHNRRQSKYKDDLKKPLLEESEKQYKESCVNFKQFQEQLAYAFYVLSENIANYAKFSGIDIDDAIQEGVLICFEKIDRFDPRKGKAFNYMTTCILNHMRQLYRSARNYNELKRRYGVFLQEKLEHVMIRNGKETHKHDC